MKQSVKAVLFDLDDTLWAIEPVLQRAEAQLFDWLRQHAPRLASQHSVGSLRERRQALLAAEPAYQINLWALRHAVLTQALRESEEDLQLADPAMVIFTTARNSVEPFDDVVPGLQRLAQRLVLGTISNGFADLKHIGLADHFRTSLAAHQFGSAKPDPAIFHAACDAPRAGPIRASRPNVSVGVPPAGSRRCAATPGAGSRPIPMATRRPEDKGIHMASL